MKKVESQLVIIIIFQDFVWIFLIKVTSQKYFTFLSFCLSFFTSIFTSSLFSVTSSTIGFSASFAHTSNVGSFELSSLS